MTFEGRVRVDGHFIGRLYTEDVLEIGPDGFVDGEADVAQAVVGGRVKGRLRVRELLIVEATAHLEGVVDAAIAEIRRGARLDAQMKVGSG
jgi:cytoskeletal protein CcmA (bactofilin family)